MRTRHEQAVLLEAAERQIGAAVGKANEADGLAFGIEDPDAVQFLGLRGWRAGAAPTAPNIAIRIDPDSVERSGAMGVDQLCLVGQRASVRPDVIGPAQPVRLRTRFNDVE